MSDPNLNQFIKELGNQLTSLASFVQKFANSQGAGKSSQQQSESQKNNERKKAEKKKDPNAPRKPISCFMHYQASRQTEIRKNNPKLNFKEVVKMVGEEWKNMNFEQKKVFVKMEEDGKKEYATKLAEYIKNKPKSTVSAPQSTTAVSQPPVAVEKSKSEKKQEKIADKTKAKQTAAAVVNAQENKTDSDSDSDEEKVVKPPATPAKSKVPKKVVKPVSPSSSSESSSSDSEPEPEPVQKKKKKN